jgi:hypothetical protein
MWTCSHCAGANSPAAAFCEVCSQPREKAATGTVSTDPGDDWHVAEPTRPLWVWIAAAAAVVIALGVGGAIGIPRFLRSDEQTAAVPAGPDNEPAPAEVGTDPGATDSDATESDATESDASETTVPPTTGSPAADPTGSGLVAIAPAVTDRRAPQVAAMLDTYFSGINTRDYAAAATALDPAGSIDPTDRSQLAAFARGTRSTRDSDVKLTGLTDAASGRLRAAVTFRSEQDPGDGPKRNRDETCSRWSITYTIAFARVRAARPRADWSRTGTAGAMLSSAS